MTEAEIVGVIQTSAAQITQIVSQIIAINFAMIVAIYYFLNQASWRLKLATFLLYSLGLQMYVLLAAQQSAILGGAAEIIETWGAEDIGPVLLSLEAFAKGGQGLALNITLNLSIYALWFGVAYLLFFWKRRGRAQDAAESDAD
ncbi:MAG: hypothetical protein AAFX03_01935 [Pseudomonadota bacterium]